MESGKQGTSSAETSSEENNGAQVNRETKTKRSYECTYCKRGFTNAQALGGHMNIHRKDRAKAKQHGPVSVSSSYQNDQETVSDFVAASHFSSTAAWPYHPVPIDYYNHSNDKYNLHQPPPGPSMINAGGAFPHGYPNRPETPPPDQSPFYMSNGELMGADLSLHIDSTSRLSLDRDDYHHDVEARSGSIHDEALDLELRLGHRSY